jgi:hypothetical protein
MGVLMARFIRLSRSVLNLELVAVVRPISNDTVAVITSLGHTEYYEGQDARDILAFLLDMATNPVPTSFSMQVADVWLQETGPDIDNQPFGYESEWHTDEWPHARG